MIVQGKANKPAPACQQLKNTCVDLLIMRIFPSAHALFTQPGHICSFPFHQKADSIKEDNSLSFFLFFRNLGTVTLSGKQPLLRFSSGISARLGGTSDSMWCRCEPDLSSCRDCWRQSWKLQRELQSSWVEIPKEKCMDACDHHFLNLHDANSWIFVPGADPSFCHLGVHRISWQINHFLLFYYMLLV
jgi:hypothetical protein